MFNFDKFVNEIHKQYNEKFTEEEIKDLLFIEDFEKDNPYSPDKRLIINRLKVKGKKNQGEIIDYDKTFYSGVNVLYADNGKGKSSTFKIIKFALTGDKESIKKDVLTWLEEIYLEFNIGNIVYTTYINLKGKRVNSILFRMDLEEILERIEKNESIEKISILFEEKTEKNLKEQIQEFFFNQFSYYSLKWTSGTKGTINLVDNQTSWKTYYKSIYLESKDYNVLFLNSDYGSQGKKILEMLLGLRLTYAINNLTRQRDYLDNSLQKQEFITKQKEEHFDQREILKELEQVNNEIQKLQEHQKASFKKSIDFQTYNELSRKIRINQDELQELDIEKEEIQKQIIKISRSTIRINEELNFGLFFSNLEIKMCPRCEHEIDSKKKNIEKKQHKCLLCEHEVIERDEDQKEALLIKLSELEKNKERLEEGFNLIIEVIGEKEKEIKDYELKLQVIENNIESFDFNFQDIDSLSRLVERRIELECKVNEQKYTVEQEIDELKEKLKVLNYAIKYLVDMRMNLSQDIIQSLKHLILTQLHKFGLVNVTDVIINKNLEISFMQNEQLNKFEDLTEGEQLRAKIAFFLALILLDIEYSVGRHPRFLIIDSPGKEEIISEDLIGLSNIFKGIEENFNTDLQIIIGTALEQLKEASTSDKVDAKETNEYVF
ncbi:hypothetical protein ACL9SP_01430 [Priestia flexa]|uniref:hypothetical protein n=1 Tax=Priestia flexa TaxID=86664 RepID=UPI0039B61858